MLEHEVHGKLTGAGGDGGCVLGFYVKQSGEASQNQNLIQQLEKMGYSVDKDIQISNRGILLEYL